MKKLASKITSPKINITRGIGLTPLGDRLLIQEVTDVEGKTEFGIYLPTTIKEDKNSRRGKVVAVGEGRVEDGKPVPIRVKTGDMVLYQWGDKISYNGEEYVLVRESEVIAVINN